MSVNGRALGAARTRAERARLRRARQATVVEAPAPLRRTRPKRRKTLRRRYDLALPVELGAEIRLPAIPVVRPGPRLLSVGLLLVTLWILTQVLHAPGLITAEAAVMGGKLMSPAQVRSVALTEGMPSFLIDPKAVAAALTAHAEIAAAQVTVLWPDRVEIRIQEREPMVAWDDAGRKWWLSRDGVAFLQHGEWPGLVQVTTQEPALNITQDPLAVAISPDVLVAAKALSAQLPEADSLNYDPVEGLNFDDSRGWTAVFGSGGDMRLKVKLYRGIVGDLSQRGISPALISVADPSTPFYRMVR